MVTLKLPVPAGRPGDFYRALQLGYGADSPGTMGQSLIGVSLASWRVQYAASMAGGCAESRPRSVHCSV